MPSNLNVIADVTGGPCRWISFQDALRHFATYEGKTQSQEAYKTSPLVRRLPSSH
jgi:hypothetical protein